MSLPSSLFILGYEGTTPPDELIARIGAGRAGGVILFARNIGTLDEVAESVARLGEAARTRDNPPLIVSIDQEGGRVQRLKEPLTRWPAMARLAEKNDAALSERVGYALAEELRLLGFNLDFAPVLDIQSNPLNSVIGDRAFGRKPEDVINHALAFWRGLERAGVRGCGKHFPGHGETLQDSHVALPRVDADYERLESIELAPFYAAVRAGMTMLMTAHVIYPAVDERPATMSKIWIEEILRGRLGYQGVVLSDDLDMKAVSEHFSVEDVIFSGLEAGVDMFLLCRDAERQAAAEGALDRAWQMPSLKAKIEQALVRAERFRRSLAPACPVPREQRQQALPNLQHQEIAAYLNS